MAKKVIGTSTCSECGGAVHVVENERGTIGYTCVPCDFSPYFKAHTDGHRHRLAKTTLKAAPAPEPVAAKPEPKPTPAPATKPAPAPAKAPAPRGIFHI